MLGSLEHGDGVRAFAGHSGWGEGQLENEMKQNAWKICPPHPVLLDRPAAPALWMAFAGEDQRWRNLISLLPKDAGQN